MTDTMEATATVRKPRKKAAPKTAKKTTKPANDAAERRPATRSPLTRREATELAQTVPAPEEGMGSGAYIRALLMLPAEDDAGTCRFTAAQIVGLVRFHFKHSSAGPSDVNWNKNWLRKRGTPPLTVRRA
jgi:hypothetical protein